MPKHYLTDGSGRWFDSDKSIAFSEDTYWNGTNHISKATGSQHVHQTLYYTAGGTFVLEHTSQWAGSQTSFTILEESDAADWLIANKCLSDPDYDKLPQSFRDSIAQQDASNEL